jgi:5'-nucleotidase
VIGIYDNGTSFAVASAHGEAVVRKLLGVDFGPDCLMNVNFPDCRPDEVGDMVFTRQGKRTQNYLMVDERLDNRGDRYYWLNFKRDRGQPPADTDIAAAFNKKISVTPISMNLTHDALLHKLPIWCANKFWMKQNCRCA